MGSILYRP